jgi:mono/diheme cytochrome c family protein
MIRARTATAVLAVAALAGCGSSSDTTAERGHDLIVHYGCGACHTIDGVRGADAEVGPRLTNFRDGRYIAGRLVRNHRNTVRWILDPRAIQPHTIMPDLGVSREEAEAIATYLFSQ